MTLPVALCGITCGTLWNLGRLPVALCGEKSHLPVALCGIWAVYLWHFVEKNRKTPS